MAGKFRDYLIGNKTIVYTDNNPLSHLSSAKLDSTEQRWVADLACFELELKHKPGKENVNTDVLSRQVRDESEESDNEVWEEPYVHGNFIRIMELRSWLEWEDVENKQKQCEVLGKVREILNGEEVHADSHLTEREIAVWRKEKGDLAFRDGILHKVEANSLGNLIWRVA